MAAAESNGRAIGAVDRLVGALEVLVRVGGVLDGLTVDRVTGALVVVGVPMWIGGFEQAAVTTTVTTAAAAAVSEVRQTRGERMPPVCVVSG